MLKKSRLTLDAFKREIKACSTAIELATDGKYGMSYTKENSLYNIFISDGKIIRYLFRDLGLREAYDVLYPFWLGFQIGKKH